ncbi:hypothetical protein [Sphingomonas sp. 32-62-10]|uniref:hypothetical protein n=1 Tax=Sphingomonas sp. 32-62-10 TaxID=1970436 RepID=UPI000BC66541|nr:MAG: hypothetical protein B7Z43_06380 [Sphingomonas sp. 12-62-6]OYX40591.1 MAG: hypothetical protein B7Y98_00655 [Sphingomonas sp. 32-62-10]
MDDTDDLVERLLVLAGGLMEDASTVAVLRESGSVDQRLAVVQQAARDVGALVEAIAVIRRDT